MTLRLEHHSKILTVLKCLDCDILTKGSAYFGDGTLLAMILKNIAEVRTLILLLLLVHKAINTYAQWYLRVGMKHYFVI